MTSAALFKWLIAIGAILSLAACDKVIPQKRTVCVTGYNEFDRKIHEFWLDNEHKAGCFGNPSAKEPGIRFGGGGGFSCGCSVTPGEKVSLQWEMAQNWNEYQRGAPPERHLVWVTIPQPESSDSRYLRIYFMKDGSTPMQWVDEMGAPELPPSRPGVQE